MTRPDRGDEGHRRPLDDEDLATLDGVRTVYSAADPVPTDLVERILFALDLENDAELLRLVSDDTAAAGARATENARTITFDSPSLTIMVTVTVTDGQTVRLDGWLAPAAARTVQIRTDAGTVATTADDDGRFVLDQVRRGQVQLFVPAGEAARLAVRTPYVLL